MLKRLFKKDKWTLYLFYNGIKIKKLKIDENEAPADNSYSVRILGKKWLFGSNNVVIVVKPVRLLKTDEEAKKTYWGVIFERGVDIE